MKISRRKFMEAGIGAGVASVCLAHNAYGQRSGPARRIPMRLTATALSGERVVIDHTALRDLTGSLDGLLLLDGDFGYDDSRRLWNAQHDRYPAAIVRAHSVEDVANAVTFAREHELLLAVKGGGHSWPGRSVADGALMIDLGALNGVLVDVENRQAAAGGGALLYSLDYSAQKHGLATTTGVVSHTGVGGFTLGGGFGRLNRKHGLAIDNLLAAQLVTADGKIRRVSADEDEDLFWAIRGGGGNFGVVTRFEYQLHEAHQIMLGGDILWPIAQARDVLDFYAEYSTDLSDEMYVGPYLTALPDGTGVIGMDVCYCGELAAGERELRPLRDFLRPWTDGVRPTPYVTLQTRFDGAWRPGIRSYAKNGMVSEITPALISAIVDNFRPSDGVFVGTHVAGGAVARAAECATAWPHRNAVTMIAVGAAWTDEKDDDERRLATRRIFEAIEPHTGGYYDNIDSDDLNVSSNFGPAYGRLVSIKNKYDPRNLFRLNSNIEPGSMT